MPDKELNHMAQEAAQEAHGLHKMNTNELDEPFLVNTVPSNGPKWSSKDIEGKVSNLNHRNKQKKDSTQLLPSL